MNENKAMSLRIICATGMMMAINIALSSFGLPVPGGHLYLNDIIICTAAILLPPAASFAVGGIGAFIGDMLFYPAPMFVSLVTHGLQALVITMCVRHLFCRRHKIAAASIGVAIGAVVMVAGYSLGRAFIYSTPEYAIIKLPYQTLQAGIGAVISVPLCYKFGIEKAYNRIISHK